MICSITTLLLTHLGYTCGYRPLPSQVVIDSPRPPSHHIDLSYQSHLSGDDIAESIRDQILRISADHKRELESNIIQTDAVTNDYTADNPDSKMTTMAFDIDISSSFLRDKEIDNIMDAIASKESGNKNDRKDDDSPITQRYISIQARMNPLTPKGAITLLNRLIVWGEMNTVADANLDANVDTNADADADTNGDADADANAANETITQINQADLFPLDAAENTTHEEVLTIEEDNNNNATDKVIKTGDVKSKQDKTENDTDLEKTFTEVNVYLDSIDIGFNYLGLHEKDFDTKKEAFTAYEQQSVLMKALENVIKNSSGLACPRVLRMDHCFLGPPICRSIGRGIVDNAIKSAEKLKQCNDSSVYVPPKHRLQALFLGGNTGIGDDGATALAAALKIAPRLPTFIIPKNEDSNEDTIDDNETEMSALLPVLSTLNLSVCGIGDTGAEALAIAVAYNPGCIDFLDLSGNQISDGGAGAIGSALHASMMRNKQKSSSSGGNGNGIVNTEPFTFVDTIDLSNNKKIGDEGVSKLAAAITCGAVRCLSLRSCSVGADGASVVGKALGKLASSDLLSTVRSPASLIVEIDLSGNKLGSYETKKKSKKYSASALTSKASETTASYMNFIGKKNEKRFRAYGRVCADIRK